MYNKGKIRPLVRTNLLAGGMHNSRDRYRAKGRATLVLNVVKHVLKRSKRNPPPSKGGQVYVDAGESGFAAIQDEERERPAARG